MTLAVDQQLQAEGYKMQQRIESILAKHIQKIEETKQS
jgi:hypothetical protein